MPKKLNDIQYMELLNEVKTIEKEIDRNRSKRMKLINKYLTIQAFNYRRRILDK